MVAVERNQVDVDGNGTVNPVQFRRLAKLTLQRAHQQKSTTPSSRREKNYATADTPAIGRRAEEATQEQPLVVDDLEGGAATRLKAADPFGLGVITFSECVHHLRRDITTGTRLESGRRGGCLGDRRKVVGRRSEEGGKDATAVRATC